MSPLKFAFEDDHKTSLMMDHYKKILEIAGEDVNREGLLKTPERAAKAMQFLLP